MENTGGDKYFNNSLDYILSRGNWIRKFEIIITVKKGYDEDQRYNEKFSFLQAM